MKGVPSSSTVTSGLLESTRTRLVLFLLVVLFASVVPLTPAEAFLLLRHQPQQPHSQISGPIKTTTRRRMPPITATRSPATRMVTTSNSGIIPALSSTTSSPGDTITTSTTVTPPPPPSEQQREESDNTSDQFDWFKTWYPLVPVDFLDEGKPHHFTLLGKDVVVWKDSAVKEGANGKFGPKPKKKWWRRLLGGSGVERTGGEWRVFLDECPHRKVPLSEGRIENDGSLLCSYHAWRFDGDGKVIDVPQIIDHNTNNSSSSGDSDSAEMMGLRRRANCNAFPSQVIDGILWVWGEETGTKNDNNNDAMIESALTPPQKYNSIEKATTENNNNTDNRFWKGAWNFRELPYGSDYFIENVVDPAHVSVSHHNVVGSRYGDQRRDMKIVSNVTKDGFAFSTIVPGVETGDTRVTFRAPSCVSIETQHPNDAALTLELYATPSRPGFCYHVGRSVIVKGKDGKMPPLLRQFTLPLPIWLNHVLTSAFLNQDALFLHKQERYLAKTNEYASYRKDGGAVSASAATKSYEYTKAVNPIGVDKGVLAFRNNWLQKLAGGFIPYANNPTMPEADNEVVFDVWNAHTKYCKVCQNALSNLKRTRFAAFFVSACLVALRPAGAAAAGNNKKAFLSLAGALLSAGLGLALNKLIGMFYRYEFLHSHND